MRPLLRLGLVCCAAPLCFGFVSLHGTGDASLQVGGTTPGAAAPIPGVRYATALFDSSASAWRRDGVFLRARFESARDTGTLTVDFDTRVLTQPDSLLHLPSFDVVRVRYEERRNGAVVFAEDAVSGELRVTWRANRAPLLRLALTATFRGAQAGSAYRDVEATLRFQEPDRAFELAVVLPALGLSVVGFGSSVPPPPQERPPQGQPGSTVGDVVDGLADVVDIADAVSQPGCGGDAPPDDAPSCGDSGPSDGTPSCGESGGGGEAPGCGSGGGGGGSGCEGLSGAGECGGGAVPDCSAASTRGRLGHAQGVVRRRRPVVVRYLPYAALFVFIGGLKWRLRRRAAHRATPRTR